MFFQFQPKGIKQQYDMHSSLSTQLTLDSCSSSIVNMKVKLKVRGTTLLFAILTVFFIVCPTVRAPNFTTLLCGSTTSICGQDEDRAWARIINERRKRGKGKEKGKSLLIGERERERQDQVCSVMPRVLGLAFHLTFISEPFPRTSTVC